jgi:hypothetical protein
VTTRWNVECWNCGGNGRTAGCFEDCCSCTGDPDDPDFCCAPNRCNVCNGRGFYQVTQLTDDNYDRAVPAD